MKKWTNIGTFGAAFLVLRGANAVNSWLVGLLITDNTHPVKSFFWMSAASVVLCYVLIKIYDLVKKDWFSLELLKHRGEDDIEHNSITRKITKHKKRGKYVLLIALLLGDPTLTVLYYREGSYLYNGIPSKKVLLLFLISIVLTNILWTAILLSIKYSWIHVHF